MMLVKIDKMSVRYGDFYALNDVCMEIYSDDFLGIVGPNGGGKTTLIKAIIGALPYSGTIDYNNCLGNDSSSKIGYLPQQNSFDRQFPISVVEVVMSGLQSTNKLTQKYSHKDRNIALELLDQVNISDLANKPIGEISGGQMQRALLCRAIISQPKLLILDEPATYVDNKFEKELYAILKELNNQMAIVMVSHDLGTISSVVKNIICVNRNVHRHNSNKITAEQLHNYDCPIQLVYHDKIPHTVLERH